MIRKTSLNESKDQDVTGDSTQPEGSVLNRQLTLRIFLDQSSEYRRQVPSNLDPWGIGDFSRAAFRSVDR